MPPEFNLTGLPSSSPIPRTAREFRWAQGASTGGGAQRPVVLVAYKTSAGSETVDTIDMARPIRDDADAQARAGKRSVAYWMYKMYVAVDPTATVYLCCPAEQSGAAANVVLTITTTADADSIVFVTWATERLAIPVSSGDTAPTIAAAIVAKVAADPFLPFVATQGSGGNTHLVTVAAANLGTCGDQICTALRISWSAAIATTIAKAAVTVSTETADWTTAIAALAKAEIYYHAVSLTATSAITATDNQLGEYIEMIRRQALPDNGKDQIIIAASLGSQSQGTTVATSSGGNTVYGVLVRAQDNDWHTGMIAAHIAAVKRSQEMIHPCANINGYTNSDSTPFLIQPPYDIADRPSTTEMAADLNNGVTSFGFTPSGQAYIARQVTMYSWTGTSATKDYRCREGHIPSGTHYAWAELARRHAAVKQPFVADDQKKGTKPLGMTMTPSVMRRLALDVIDDLTGPFVNGAPVLDPSPAAIERMKASVNVTLLADGFGVTITFEVVRHNNKQFFQVSQQGPGY
jgi:phage tail sheath gpL-like